MNALSSWVESVAPSLTLEIAAKAKALRQEGKDVCSFAAGEPDFDTPEFIKEACIEALRSGRTKYLPATGLLELREALVEKYAQDNGIQNLSPENIVVSPGGKFSCHLGIMAVCSPGDEVIIPAPYWLSYPEMVKLVGAKPVLVDTVENGFKLTVKMLENVVSQKTKLLIFNSPSNPTGTVYSKEEISEIVAYCVEEDIYVLSDEIYEYLVYEGVSHFSPASNERFFPKVITTGGFSKTFSMTGWRLGVTVADKKIAKAIASLQSHMTSNATTFAQYGALAAIKERSLAKEAIESMRKQFQKRRDLLFDGLKSISGLLLSKPQGAFYLFPSIEKLGIPSMEFSKKLLEDQYVAVIPGAAFGAENYVRLSYATSEKMIEKGIERLRHFINQL